MAQENQEQIFQVSEEACLNISNLRGQVTIRAGEAGKIQVKGMLDPASGEAERTKIEFRQEENGEVVVKTLYNEPFWGFFTKIQPCRVIYELSVPAHCQVRASTISAELCVAGIEGELKLSTVSGNMKLDELAGDLSASTVSGDINASGLKGKLTLHSVSGDARLEQTMPTLHLGLEKLDATTVSGDIFLQTGVSSGPYHFQTVSGDVHWTLPEPSACTIEMHSVSGEAYTNLPVSHRRDAAGSRSLAIHGGGVPISFSTVSGDFHLSAPLAQSENLEEQRRNILERVANGDLTPEEGLQAFKI